MQGASSYKRLDARLEFPLALSSLGDLARFRPETGAYFVDACGILCHHCRSFSWMCKASVTRMSRPVSTTTQLLHLLRNQTAMAQSPCSRDPTTQVTHITGDAKSMNESNKDSFEVSIVPGAELMMLMISRI